MFYLLKKNPQKTRRPAASLLSCGAFFMLGGEYSHPCPDNLLASWWWSDWLGTPRSTQKENMIPLTFDI